MRNKDWIPSEEIPYPDQERQMREAQQEAEEAQAWHLALVNAPILEEDKYRTIQVIDGKVVVRWKRSGHEEIYPLDMFQSARRKLGRPELNLDDN